MARLLLALLCLALTFGCDKVPKPATEAIEERNSAAATRMPKDPDDAKFFTDLKRANHDFSKPIKVHYFLYFPEEAAARGALQVLSTDGYNGEISLDNGEWMCHLVKEMKLDADTIDMERFKFRDLTINSGGHYEGAGVEGVN